MNSTKTLPFNPRSADFRANPYPTYDYLRTHHPIYYRQAEKDWILTRYDDVSQVFKSTSFGRSDKQASPSLIDSSKLNPFIKKRYESQQLMAQWLALLNPPDHTRVRNVLRSSFTQAKAQQLKSYLEETIDRLIDQVQDRGKMDIITDLAYPLTLGMNCKILGIPQSEWHPSFKQWLGSLILLADIDARFVDTEQGMLSIMGLAEYFRGLIDQYYNNSSLQADSIINTLVKAQKEGAIAETEVIANCIFLFFGGHATTVKMIGLSVLHLLKHPKQLHLLKANPSLIKTAVAEVMRYDNPIQGTSRTLFEDLQLSDRVLRRGERVHCLIGAANRDPDKFINPNEFDITRNPNPYLSFGQGIHTCIGKHFANLMTETIIVKLVSRLPKLDLDPEYSSLKWDDSFLSHGLKELMVKF